MSEHTYTHTHNFNVIGIYKISVINLRRMRQATDAAYMGGIRNAHNILVGKREGKRLLGKPTRRWEDNV
jgi:hypothetical protein